MRVWRALVVVLVATLPSCGGGGSPGGPSTTPGAPSCPAGTPVSGAPALTTQRIASGLESPLDLQAPPGDRARVFVVEQPGRIRVVRNGTLLGTPFLDISSQVTFDGEQGLLGLAFHPRYSENGRFYLNYSDRSGNTHVSEFHANPNADLADAGSERQILFVEQPSGNHNGGGMVFGSDGFLYIGLGDGGDEGDPFGNGQNLARLLGKMLRIDVDRGSPYAIPADNPFVSRAGARGEIWALGLRNPWRYSFNRANGDLYVGDVGQARREEVDIGTASRRGGENYGWNIMEGSLCFKPSSGCSTSGLTLPVLEYSSSEGCSVIGGPVYQGCRMPGYQGTYFYADFCSAFIRSFRFTNGSVTERRDWTEMLGRGEPISSFGVDADGEVYIVEYSGAVHKVVPVS